MSTNNRCVIILISGKRKSGKDYVASKLAELFRKSDLKICSIHLSEPLKREYANLHNLDAEKLMTSSTYKEMHRKEMVEYGERLRNQDPSYFCRLAVDQCPDWPRSDVRIVCDCRRPTDLVYFKNLLIENSKNYQGNGVANDKNCLTRLTVITLRIEADENSRIGRGWIFTPGIDDSETETALDRGVKWDYVFDNSSSLKKEETDFVLDLEVIAKNIKDLLTSCQNQILNKP